MRTHEIPDVKRQAKGIPIINLIEVDQGEKVTALIDMEVFSDEQYLVMVTKLGQIKKTPAAAYAAVRRNGLIAINLQDDDELNWVRRSSGGNEVLVVTRQGKGSRFTEKEVRPMGRDTMGVGAIRLRKGDEVAGLRHRESRGPRARDHRERLRQADPDERLPGQEPQHPGRVHGRPDRDPEDRRDRRDARRRGSRPRS